MIDPTQVLRSVKENPRLYSAWRAVARTRLVRLLRRPGLSRRTLQRLAATARSGDHSYAGEGPYLRRLLSVVGIDGGYVVDLAAGDGVNGSSTLELFRSPAWAGLAIEMDARQFRRLRHAYAGFRGAQVLQARVTPENVVRLLKDNGVPPRIEVLNLDLDSYDLWVAIPLLEAFRVGIVSMEINEKIPPPLYFAVKYSPTHEWQEDHFYGCSLVAACEHLKPLGYVLQGLEYNNAFFVDERVAAGHFTDVDAGEAYACGYLNRPDRRVLFPWNFDMEELQEVPPERATELLRRAFEKYEGRYDLRAAP